jgi:hypothetical protein
MIYISNKVIGIFIANVLHRLAKCACRGLASTDVDAKRYEVRYGGTSGSCATATVIDVVDVLHQIPPSADQTGGVR